MERRSIIFARRVFQVAGIYGLLVLVPQYFIETRIGRDYPPPITHPEFYYGFTGVAVAWQVLFLILARDPVRYRPMMIPSILEKAGFGIAAFCLFAAGRVAPALLVFATLDLIFGVLFALAWFRTAGVWSSESSLQDDSH